MMDYPRWSAARQASLRAVNNLGSPAWLAGAALLTFAAPWILRNAAFFEEGSGALVIVHLVIELFSVCIAVLVVVTAWNAFLEADRHAVHPLILGFTVMAGLDLLHALSYVGMPDFGSPASTEKAIFFWFMARAFDLLTFWLLALRIPLPGKRWHWLTVALCLIALVFGWGTWRLEWFPVTYVPGEGATTVNRLFDLALFMGYGAAAWVFAVSDTNDRNRCLARACFLMALSQLLLHGFVDTGNALLFIGHLFKVAAFVLLFRGTFLVVLKAPHVDLRRRERELDTLLTHIPAGLARIDTDGRFVYVNPRAAHKWGLNVEDIIGRTLHDILAPVGDTVAHRSLACVLSGQEVFYEAVYSVNGRELHAATAMVPEYALTGRILGAIIVALDVTHQRYLQHAAANAAREVIELKTALDAHAIVAITDRAGVITEVNDKFCAISGYAREELIGQTHRIINSGHHPRCFFDDLWRTITSGKVWVGEVCNRAKNGSLYWVQTTIVPYMDDRGRPGQYIAIRADITERKLAEQRVQRMALFDPVTELPNRRLLADRLQTAYATCRRSGHHGALLLLDLDDFKTVNDTLGHPQGDELLRQVGSRLTAGTREADTVARMGGDEFAVVLQELSGDLTEAVLQAQDVAHNLLKALAVPYQLGDAVADSAASIGVVVFPDGEADVPELLKHADIALYHAKEEGKNRVGFFDVSLQSRVLERAHLAADLRLALERGELQVYYQPIMNRHAVVVGCEALLRWQHPVRGMVSPAVFIPLAEQAGAIVAIGKWVFEQACRQVVRWQQDPQRAGMTVSVNVSARQMRDRDFVDFVRSTIASTGADARLLRLEITESLLQEDINDTIRKMDRLRGIGVQFALDDFGTGYSSLSYLRRLPLHSVKIDRAFVDGVVTDPNDAAIAQTILALAKTLGLQVVAEGVEDRGQFDFLSQHGCDAYQGFLFSEPLPPDRLEAFLRAFGDSLSNVQ